jgi:hypothetical protein
MWVADQIWAPEQNGCRDIIKDTEIGWVWWRGFIVPATEEAEVRGCVWDQSEQYSETQSQKKKNKRKQKTRNQDHSFFGSTGIWTQGLELSMQVPYYLGPPLALFLLYLFFREDLGFLPRTSLRQRSSYLLLPNNWDHRDGPPWQTLKLVLKLSKLEGLLSMELRVLCMLGKCCITECTIGCFSFFIEKNLD